MYVASANSRVGHYCRGIRVDKNDPVALFFQGFYGLGTGIIELAGLPYDYWAGTYYKYGFDVCSFRHFFLSSVK